MQLKDRIGRRMKLHDLHVLMAVADTGSMGKAAVLLRTTQPAISKSVADLENAIGARLLDRSPQGVVPTAYGRALLEGGTVAFDELRQAVKNIEFLADPTIGEIRVGGNEAIIAGLVPAVFGRLRESYSGISIHVMPILPTVDQYRELRERKVDLVLGRISHSMEPDIDADVLFQDRVIVVAAPDNRWASKRKIKLSELTDVTWILPPSDSLIGSLVAEAFRVNGMRFPPRGSAMGSIHMFCALLARGPFVAVFPASILQFGANLPPLKVLPVSLPIPPWPVGIMTLKNRTLSPIVRLFIDCAHEVAEQLAR
jgi:DNA-binding transcriptional LysR family regulator